MAAQRYRKRPVEIEAMQFDGSVESGLAIEAWAAGFGGGFPEPALRFAPSLYQGVPRVIYIDTLEGEMTAREGDWIIKGVAGEFYPCKPDIFVATYDKV